MYIIPVLDNGVRPPPGATRKSQNEETTMGENIIRYGWTDCIDFAAVVEHRGGHVLSVEPLHNAIMDNMAVCEYELDGIRKWAYIHVVWYEVDAFAQEYIVCTNPIKDPDEAVRMLQCHKDKKNGPQD